MTPLQRQTALHLLQGCCLLLLPSPLLLRCSPLRSQRQACWPLLLCLPLLRCCRPQRRKVRYRWRAGCLHLCCCRSQRGWLQLGCHRRPVALLWWWLRLLCWRLRSLRRRRWRLVLLPRMAPWLGAGGEGVEM